MAGEREASINVTGTITGETRRTRLREALDAVAKGKPGIINLDLSRTESLDAGAVTDILVYRRRFSEAGIHLRIKNCPERIRRILGILRVEGTLTFVDGVNGGTSPTS